MYRCLIEPEIEALCVVISLTVSLAFCCRRYTADRESNAKRYSPPAAAIYERARFLSQSLADLSSRLLVPSEGFVFASDACGLYT